MKKPIIFTLTFLLFACAQSSFASEVLTQPEAKKLLRKSGCTACHAIDKTRVGPSYKDIAKHYADPKIAYLKGQSATDYLIAKIRKGTKKDNRHWTKSPEGKKYGVMTPMSKGRVSDENLKKLVSYILAVK